MTGPLRPLANDLCFTLYVARFEAVGDRACIGAKSGLEKTKGGTRQGAKKTRRDRVKSIRQKKQDEEQVCPVERQTRHLQRGRSREGDKGKKEEEKD
jgi:hypothetical protein